MSKREEKIEDINKSISSNKDVKEINVKEHEEVVSEVQPIQKIEKEPEPLPEKVEFIVEPKEVQYIENWMKDIGKARDGKYGSLSFIFKMDYDNDKTEFHVYSDGVNLTKKIR